MYTESFEIQFSASAGKEIRYFEFELWVRGMWIMDEVGGGEMRQCLDIEEMYFDKELHVDIEINFINKWIEKNQDAIRKMFTERIKKYED
jgi:hypothetical protein